LQTQAAAPAQPGGMSAAEIAAATAAQRAGILTNATAAWQKQQDARRAELQKQLDAAKQEEQAIQAKAIADAQAKTAGLSMSYIDAQGNVRAADSYRNIKAGENAQGSSPGDGYSYFEFDNPDAGTKTPRTIQVGDSEQIVYDEAPARTGAWLKSGKVGVADPSLVGADPTQVDPKTLRSYQLKQQLDALAAEKFDSSKVDYSAADAAGGQAALDGAMVRAMMDQAEMDQITGTAQSNAARLAARTKAYEDESYKDITDYTGGDSGILNRYRSDIDADVGRAVADARYGQTAATNSAIRQAMRYGLNAPANTAGLATQQASQIAAAANNTRNSAIDNYRSLVGQGIGLKRDAFTTGQAATLDSMNKGEQALRAGRDMRIQNESLDWAKKLDVTGMARGMPGASQGAYSVATNAGNSAVSNQMAPGQALQGAMAQSANTQLQGRQIAQQGLGSILSSQTSQYGANSAAGTAQSGQMLNAIGTGLGYAFSDARLKRNVVKLSDDPRGFSWYEFEYLWGSRRHVGVMAHEVERVLPAAVIDIDGFKAVNYNLL
ncbi:MAG TPA: tail fiber domain-containing protein, partial [Azonexus sp.]|nr:tail fiber domain-containing protein [Azonexus sp.]